MACSGNGPALAGGGTWAGSDRCCTLETASPGTVKPLVRLGERDMAAYCVLRGIDYMVEECPMALGNRHIGYKEALNSIEERSPGTKHAFYFGFLDRAADLFVPGDDDRVPIGTCVRCGAPCRCRGLRLLPPPGAGRRPPSE